MNPEKVKLVFKHLPLRMHELAEPAAMASIAAQNQGKFWQYHDALFSQEKLTKESIEAAAVATGLDMEQFKKDLANPITRQRMLKDMADATRAGVSGTPTLFVNGQRVKNRSLPAIQELIDRELKEAGK